MRITLFWADAVFFFNCLEGLAGGGDMAVPLLSKKIVKKRVKKFKRPQSDRKVSVKVKMRFLFSHPPISFFTLHGGGNIFY